MSVAPSQEREGCAWGSARGRDTSVPVLCLVPVSLARGLLPWARCSGRLPHPSVPRALLPTGAGRAAAVPGTSYLGNVRNAPCRGFFLPREPSVPGAETPTPCLPCLVQAALPCGTWLAASMCRARASLGLPQSGNMMFPSSSEVWGPDTGAGLQGASPGDAGCHSRQAGAGRTWQCLGPRARLVGSECWDCTIPRCRLRSAPTLPLIWPRGMMYHRGILGSAGSLGWGAGTWSCQQLPLRVLLPLPVQELQVPWSMTQRGIGGCWSLSGL